jgi:hypothetical protein
VSRDAIYAFKRTCIWFNIANVSGETEYSVDNFVKYYLEHKSQADKKDSL